MPTFATAVRRGCGTRKKGGVYMECGLAGLGEEGYPLEYFIVDPPLPIVPEEIGLSPVGLRMIERDGAWHVFDWVGETHYPDIAGFLEEVRRYGLSRGPIPKQFDFAKLTPASRWVLVHRKAWIEQRAAYYDEWRQVPGLGWLHCPKGGPDDHVPPPSQTKICCAGLWWQDIEPNEKAEVVAENPRDVTVAMPAFVYDAVLRPEGHMPEYSPAIFGSFPIHRLAVVRDAEGKRHERGMEVASNSGLPVDLVED